MSWREGYPPGAITSYRHPVTRPSTREATARSIHPRYSVPTWNFSRKPRSVWKRLEYSRPSIQDFEDIEDLKLFAPGGYHPIHLQDELDNGRYRVINKFGLWEEGVFWLCRDQHAETPRYVVVDILIAKTTGTTWADKAAARRRRIRRKCRDEPDLERRLRLPLREFTSKSPNGTHTCRVYSVVGPSLEEAALLFGGRYDESNDCRGRAYNVDTDSLDPGLGDVDIDTVSDYGSDASLHDPGSDSGSDSDSDVGLVGPNWVNANLDDSSSDDGDFEDRVRERDGFQREMENSRMLRRLCRDAAETIAMLHRRGICHGGIEPENVFIEMASLDGKDEQEVLSLLGKPEIYPVVRKVDNRRTPEIPNAPDYVVSRVWSKDALVPMLRPRVCVDSFEYGFNSHCQKFRPGREASKVHAAPEVILKNQCTTSIDLWSLGCLIFKTRTGSDLFGDMRHYIDDGTPSVYFYEVTRLLPRLSRQWPLDTPFFDLAMSYVPSKPRSRPGQCRITRTAPKLSRRQRQVAGMRNVITVRRAYYHREPYWMTRITPTEVAALADLLERLLRCNPRKRLDAASVAKHPWFNGLDE